MFFEMSMGIFPKKALGIESNIPFGKINIKADATISDDFYSLDSSKLNNEGL